jgi:hypothetical protein
MTISYSAVWDDTIALTRRHATLIAAIAGVFIFLPALLFAVFLKPEDPQTEDLSRVLEMMIEWYRAAAPWLVLQGLISMIGGMAILRLVFAERTTVGAALMFALGLLPFYFLMTVISGFMILAASILFIIPGLYVWARVAPAGAVMVAENRRGPIDSIRRSFALTQGQGWAILGLVLIVIIVGAISIGVAETLLGIVFHLAAGQELGSLLATIVSSALTAAFSTLIVMLYAAIYRGLAPQTSAAVFE